MGPTFKYFCICLLIILTIDKVKTENSIKDNYKKSTIQLLYEYMERTQNRVFENLNETHAKIVSLGPLIYAHGKGLVLESIVKITDKSHQLIENMHKQLENIDLEKWDLKREYYNDEDGNEVNPKEHYKKPTIQLLIEYMERTQIREFKNLKEIHDTTVSLGPLMLAHGFNFVGRFAETTDKAYMFIENMHKQLENIDPGRWDLKREYYNDEDGDEGEGEDYETHNYCTNK